MADAEDIFHGALGWFGHFDVQHAVDPLEGVFMHDRAWSPVVDGWQGAAASASDDDRRDRNPVGSLRLTTAQLPDRTLVRLFAHFVWNASLVLAGLIDHGRIQVHGRRVVELGAGAGLPSLVAALQGAEDVVVTDYPAPPFLTNLAANADRNLPSPADRARVHVRGHGWGTPTDALEALGEHPGRFDRVLLADVLWQADLHAPLLESCRRLVKPESQGGRIYLSFGKHTGGAITDAFLQRAADAGFRVARVHEYKFPTEWGVATKLDDYNETRRTVYTYQLSLAAAAAS